MQTRFILHGGMLKHNNPHNDSFLREFTKDLHDGDTVLWIGFARTDAAERQQVFERDKGLILASKDVKLHVENADLQAVEKQMQRAQAVFVTGGDTAALVRDMETQPAFLDTLRGKVYAGSSAGAYLPSRYYFACQDDEVREGLGWLPVRIIAHYGDPAFNATDEALARLKQTAHDLELIVLAECEWTVRDVTL